MDAYVFESVDRGVIAYPNLYVRSLVKRYQENVYNERRPIQRVTQVPQRIKTSLTWFTMSSHILLYQVHTIGLIAS